ncbi:hypothetical protein M3210_03460 [Oceanobacillus luteolus]|uniref:hypothetical protein n=1 Tax=Oceanobacillus luteolus TaxID=1274358 RepID=UPI00203D4725|nr:hypothetical protein [Oceanobacillus luteolus]MCM3739321.1 hypothetical protein [Oceanobacillus luteolus]
MTAEVAVLNKHGIAMAADSAITSGREGIQKVYNTANKLFALSEKHSIGIMVYGAASFMEVPWEVIIKSYREVICDRTFNHLHDYMEDFLRFLNEDARFKNEEVEEIIVYRIFSDNLKRLVKEVEEKMASKEHMEEGVTSERVTNWLDACAGRMIQSYRKQRKWFIELEEAAFKERFSSVVNEVIDELIRYDIPDELIEKLHELAYEATVKDYFSVGSTGFVIGGYGDEEIFPQLLNYRLEGFVFGQLKYKKLKDKKISYTTDKDDGTASITAFAQRDMVDSFIKGIEPNMEDVMFRIISSVIKNYHDQIQKNLRIEFTEEEVTKLQKMGKEVYDSMEIAVKEYQEKNYVEPLLGVVRSLPKEELADMAEALVSLTTFKRRVTRATESVGPPIDVAVITKGDGFVWKKRKSYIDPQINSRL